MQRSHRFIKLLSQSTRTCVVGNSIKTAYCTDYFQNSAYKKPNTKQEKLFLCNFRHKNSFPCFVCLHTNTQLYSETNNILLDARLFEKVSAETLESLSDFFEILLESSNVLASVADVSYIDGVLTVDLGVKFGTYVINKQSPNKQIWLSSPTSGPKRYDFVTDGQYWIYKHDSITLHALLQSEFSKIFDRNVDFSTCSYARLSND